MLSPLDQLRAIADAACGERTIPSELAAAFKAAVADICDGMKADEALGLSVLPGKRRPATVNRKSERDELLSDVAARFFVGKDVAEQARETSTTLRWYVAGAWRRDQYAESNPYTDTDIRFFL